MCIRAGEIGDEFACGTHWSGEKVAEGAGGEDGSVVCNAGFEVRNGAERLGNEVWVGSEDLEKLLDERSLLLFTVVRVDGHLEELEMLVHLPHVKCADLVSADVEAELECLLGMGRVLLMFEGIAVESVGHVPVVGIERWPEVCMDVEEVDVNGCEFDGIKHFAGALFCVGESVVAVFALGLALLLGWAVGIWRRRSALV